MLVALSDTHSRDGTRLSGRTAEAVESASVLVHAGDFMTIDVLEAFDSHGSLYAVYGNNDPPAVRDRIPPDHVFECRDILAELVEQA